VTPAVSTVTRILGFIRPRLGLACGALLCAVVLSATSVGVAYLSGPALVALTAPRGGGLPEWLSLSGDLAASALVVAAALLAMAVVRALATYGQSIFLVRLRQSAVRELRERMYAHLLAASPSTWAGQRRGELASRIVRDAPLVMGLVTGQGASLLFSALTGLSLAGFALSVDPLLTGLALLGLSGVVIGPIIGALFMTVWEMFACSSTSLNRFCRWILGRFHFRPSTRL